MRKVFTITGLTFGDESKGSVVDSLVRRYKIPLVVRWSGGCNAAHNVITDNGIHHTFSQFGSGTFAGADTLLTKHVLVDPYRLLNEAEVLELKGVKSPCNLMYVDERAIVITPFHQALNKLKEWSRGNNKHGSCGVGIGETASHALKYPDHVLRVGDLKNPKLTKEKLKLIRNDLFSLEGVDVINRKGIELDIFSNEYIFDACLWRYSEFVRKVYICSPQNSLALISDLNSVWEGSQGVLLDEDVGFHPYTTWSKVTLHNALTLLFEAGTPSADITNLGVLRSYGHRHGAGPFPTEVSTVKVSPFLSEDHNKTNEWQGDFRVGHFDMVLAKYAKDFIGGELHGLAITHTDKLISRTYSQIATSYPDKNILYHIDPNDFEARSTRTDKLVKMEKSLIRYTSLESGDFVNFVSKNLNTPVFLTSNGPCFRDKIFNC